MPLMLRVIRSTQFFKQHLRNACTVSTNNPQQYLSLKEKNNEYKIPYFWLRDHCRCNKCYSKSTNQTLFNLVEIPLDISPKSVSETDNNLKVTWCDDHVSEYCMDWIKSVKFGENKSLKKIVHWDVDAFKDLKDASVEYEKYMSSTEGVKSLLNSIARYGFGIVNNTPLSLEATEEVVRKVAPVQFTLFGGMWEVTNDAKHKDTAYTQISLLPHTDNTYFYDSAGLQIFHLLSHDGKGGETLLVDGFRAIENLKVEDPKAYEILSTTPINCRYLEEGYHFSQSDTVIKLDSITKALQQIRYNIFDREVLTNLPYDEIMDYYKAYIKLGKELFSTTAVVKLKLQPGSVIFIDNWRVLHGRESYTGVRRMTGCYVSRDDWTSKANTMNVAI